MIILYFMKAIVFCLLIYTIKYIIIGNVINDNRAEENTKIAAYSTSLSKLSAKIVVIVAVGTADKNTIVLLTTLFTPKSMKIK